MKTSNTDCQKKCWLQTCQTPLASWYLFGPHSWYFATGPWTKNWKRPSSALSRSAGFAAINSCAMPYKTNDTGKNVWEPVEPVYSCLTMKTIRLNGTRIPDSLLRVAFRTLQEHYNSIGVQSEPFPACMASHPDLKTKTHYFHVTTMCIYGVEKKRKGPIQLFLSIRLPATWLNWFVHGYNEPFWLMRKITLFGPWHILSLHALKLMWNTWNHSDQFGYWKHLAIAHMYHNYTAHK